jgi:hypothetical protein
VYLLLRSEYKNRKQHAIDFDQPQSRSIGQILLEGHYSEVPFQSSAPFHLWASESSRIVDPVSQDFFWLELMESGRRGLSIKEAGDCSESFFL